MKAKDFYKKIEHELTKSGTLKKQSILFSPAFIIAITFTAVVADSSSNYICIDPMLKNNLFLNLIITLTLAFIIDILPSYFPRLINRYVYYRENNRTEANINIILLSLGIFVVAITFASLFTFRHRAAEFILASTYQYYIAMAQVSDMTFVPTFTKELAQAIMIIVDIINVGSTVTVFCVWFLNTPKEEEFEKSSLIKRTIALSKIKDKEKVQKEQLRQVVDYGALAEEQETYTSTKDLLIAQKEVERRRAINDLAATLNDADCTQYILNTAPPKVEGLKRPYANIE